MRYLKEEMPMTRDFSKATYKTNPRFLMSAIHGTPLGPISKEDREAGRVRIMEMESLMGEQRVRIAKLRPPLAANDNVEKTYRAAA
ncbi:hypothetical protein [Shinella sp.]|uniref:hypothetical protein n=1 Tax=Shinella sp. TaxID=1870904 RepID=UPI0028AB783F|nr:hypothetical protein [Shinella sp.]